MIPHAFTGVGLPSTPGAEVLAAEFTAPKVEYLELAPMLIVFGVAVIGVLVEAFLPRGARYYAQIVLSVVGYAAAFAMTLRLVGGEDKTVASGAVAVDGFTLFLWGLILVLSIVSVLVVAERSVDGGVTAFAAQASALPGSCLLYTSPSPRDVEESRMPSSA